MRLNMVDKAREAASYSYYMLGQAKNCICFICNQYLWEWCQFVHLAHLALLHLLLFYWSSCSFSRSLSDFLWSPLILPLLHPQPLHHQCHRSRPALRQLPVSREWPLCQKKLQLQSLPPPKPGEFQDPACSEAPPCPRETHLSGPESSEPEVYLSVLQRTELLSQDLPRAGQGPDVQCEAGAVPQG